jgi:hypothetical protein
VPLKKDSSLSLAATAGLLSWPVLGPPWTQDVSAADRYAVAADRYAVVANRDAVDRCAAAADRCAAAVDRCAVRYAVRYAVDRCAAVVDRYAVRYAVAVHTGLDSHLARVGHGRGFPPALVCPCVVAPVDRLENYLLHPEALRVCEPALVQRHPARLVPARFFACHCRWLPDRLRLKFYAHRVRHCGADQDRGLDEAW